jgi:hypothetical protein
MQKVEGHSRCSNLHTYRGGFAPAPNRAVVETKPQILHGGPDPSNSEMQLAQLLTFPFDFADFDGDRTVSRRWCCFEKPKYDFLTANSTLTSRRISRAPGTIISSIPIVPILSSRVFCPIWPERVSVGPDKLQQGRPMRAICAAQNDGMGAFVR